MFTGDFMPFLTNKILKIFLLEFFLFLEAFEKEIVTWVGTEFEKNFKPVLIEKIIKGTLV